MQGQAAAYKPAACVPAAPPCITALGCTSCVHSLWCVTHAILLRPPVLIYIIFRRPSLPFPPETVASEEWHEASATLLGRTSGSSAAGGSRYFSLAESEFEDAASELDPGGFDLCADWL